MIDSSEGLIPRWPESAEPHIRMHPFLHPLFKGLASPVSEFSFAGIYLFRGAHSYRLSTLPGGSVMVSGSDAGERFFMLPFGLPDDPTLSVLFESFPSLKNATEAQAAELSKRGYRVSEDRNNFDYLYLRDELVRLEGRKFHSQKNLINRFTSEHACTGAPLTEENAGDARAVISGWCEAYGPGDCEAAYEAVKRADELELCGGIYYIEESPVAFTLGAESTPDTFVVHFEKGLRGFRGLLQFVNRDFASRLPGHYRYINREQDLGDEGLRRSKESYRPAGFVRKYRARTGN